MRKGGRLTFPQSMLGRLSGEFSPRMSGGCVLNVEQTLEAVPVQGRVSV